VPIPTWRAVLLLALGLAVPLSTGVGPGLAGGGGPALLAYDLAVLLLILLDGRLAPDARRLSAVRRLREPLSAFAANRVELSVASSARRPLEVLLADAPPPAFGAVGHRARLSLPAGGEVALAYEVTPRARGRHRFGQLHLRVLGPLGLAWRRVRLLDERQVAVYPDLRGLARADAGGAPEAGRSRRPGWREGREFAALRPYADGDDLRSIDWKATARRSAPVVREWQPERNQTLWILLDCGRHLSARQADGRTKLDRAVDAALALARAAQVRGDRVGTILFGAEVERVVLPEGGPGRLGPLAAALHLAAARPVESDYGAAFDALARAGADLHRPGRSRHQRAAAGPRRAAAPAPPGGGGGRLRRRAGGGRRGPAARRAGGLRPGGGGADPGRARGGGAAAGGLRRDGGQRPGRRPGRRGGGPLPRAEGARGAVGPPGGALATMLS
jgi:uncharacterized protein (DUF58 family)